MITVTRYAIRLHDPKRPDDGYWWHVQGLPNESDFSFAILYSDEAHAKQALKGPRLRMRAEWGQTEIVPITCTYSEPLSENQIIDPYY